MNLNEHLNELRQRLIFSVIFFFITFGVSYFFCEKIYDFLLQPFLEISENSQNHRLIYTAPGEAFISYLRLSSYCALFFSLPIFAAEIYLFLSPALYKKEKKNLLITFFSMSILFLFGAVFSYEFILPLALKFFASFENPTLEHLSIPLQLETKISEYLNFTVKIIFGFSIAFQLPILLLFLIKLNFLSVENLRRKRKYWIVMIFIIAAILTPPDLLSQISLATLLIIFFEVTLLIGKTINKIK